MATAAYELGYERQVHRREPMPRLQVVQGGRSKLDKVRQALATLRGVLVAALVLGLIVTLVYSQAAITELNGEVSASQQKLTAAQSNYDFLSASMDKVTSRANIEQIAEGRLGLVKADPSQVTYIRLEDEAKIQKTDSNAAKVMSGLGTAALSLIGSLDP